VYDRDEQRRTVTREAIEAGPQSIWRYAPLLPVAPPEDVRLPVGWTPLVNVPRLAQAVGVGELRLKLDTANPTHSFKDRVVAVACAKALETGATTLACSSTGNLANAVAARAAAEGIEAAVLCPADLEPEKLIATAVFGPRIFAVEGSYDDCSRLSVELSFELEGADHNWAFVNVSLRSYYAEGSKTLGFEIAEQLGWRLPDAVVAPVASGSMFTKVHQAFAELRELGLVDDAQPRFFSRSRPARSSSRSARRRSRARLRSGVPRTASLPCRRRARQTAPFTPSPRTRSRRTSRCSRRRQASSARPRRASRSALCAKRFAAASSVRPTASFCS
jgi:threonine synthase